MAERKPFNYIYLRAYILYSLPCMFLLILHIILAYTHVTSSMPIQLPVAPCEIINTTSHATYFTVHNSVYTLSNNNTDTVAHVFTIPAMYTSSYHRNTCILVRCPTHVFISSAHIPFDTFHDCDIFLPQIAHIY